MSISGRGNKIWELRQGRSYRGITDSSTRATRIKMKKHLRVKLEGNVAHRIQYNITNICGVKDQCGTCSLVVA